MINEEKKYEKLIDDLKNLPEVNAPQNFEANLWRKINSSENEKKESFWDKIFSPGKLVPAAVVIASAVIIFFMVDIKTAKPEDPLSIQPRMRDDVIISEKVEDKNVEPLIKQETKNDEKRELKKDIPQVKLKSSDADNEIMASREGTKFKDDVIEEDSKEESLSTTESSIVGGAISPTAAKTSGPDFRKDNLNFMQINLSVKEKQEVEKLKQQMQSSQKVKYE